MASVSGLRAPHRAVARHRVLEACGLMLAHKEQVHYSQGPDRWSGITEHLLPSHGQFPAHSDCSSSATWILWNALHVPYGVRDVVNDTRWLSGYTGTIARHGKQVRDLANLAVGDLILYGYRWPYEHVAVYVGGGYVFSHGSEAGPFKLPMRYRADFAQARRFI